MRVWIEASLIALHGGGGSRRYADAIASGLSRTGEDVTVIANGANHSYGAPILPLRRPPRFLHGLWALSRWPTLTSQVDAPPPDILHCAEKVSVPPVPREVVLTVTVHDLWCLVRPNACRGRLGFLVRRAWRTRATWDLVITPTHATRDQLISLGFAADRIAVTPWGVPDAFHSPPADPESLSRRLGLRSPSLVFVGPLSVKKGGDVLLRAVDLLRERGIDVELAVRGPEDFGDMTSVLKHSTLERVRSFVRFVPPLPDHELASLYAQAGAAVFPSRCEGYNFPLVEALSVGAPAVASDIPVHREVSRGAALLVPPEDPAGLADGIERLLTGDRPKATFDPPRWADTIARTRRAFEAALAYQRGS